tara:strand:- start:481 stop:696 length:216 start_codon:yes stop_codon:yes gene_type:complete
MDRAFAFYLDSKSNPIFLLFLTQGRPAGSGSLKISVADAFKFLIYPRLKARQLLLQFSWVIAMRPPHGTGD